MYTNTNGQESPGWMSLYKFETIFCSSNLSYTSISLIKLIGQQIQVVKGWGINKDIIIIYYDFQNSTKNGAKLGQFKDWSLFTILIL